MTTTYMPVLPVRDGSVNITVSATSFMGKDTVTRSVSIKVRLRHRNGTKVREKSCEDVLFGLSSALVEVKGGKVWQRKILWYKRFPQQITLKCRVTRFAHETLRAEFAFPQLASFRRFTAFDTLRKCRSH